MEDKSAGRWKIKEKSFTEAKGDRTFDKPKAIKRTLNAKPEKNKTNKTKMLIRKSQQQVAAKPLKRHAQNFSAAGRKGKDVDLKSAKQRRRSTKQFTLVGAKNKIYYNKSPSQHLQDLEPSVILHQGHSMRVRDRYHQKSAAHTAHQEHQDKRKSRFSDSDQRLQAKNSRIKQTAKHTAYKAAHDKMEEYGEENLGVRTAHRAEQSAEILGKSTGRFVKTARQTNHRIRQNRLYQKSYKAHKSQLYEKQRLHERPDDAHQAAKPKKTIDIQKRINRKKMYYRVQVQHKMAEIQEVVQKRGFRLLLDAAKQIVVRNRILLIGFALVLLFTLICCGVTLALTGALTLLETTTYNADRAELDKIVEYITDKDQDTIDKFDRMGDSYDRYTLKYIGTGQIATSPMQMLSYINVLLKDQFDFAQAKPPIDDMYTLMYTYTSHVTNDGTAEAPIWHLWVTVDCKTVTQVIDEQNLFEDFDRQWYDILNQTGGNYLAGNLGNPFPGIDWTGSITDPYGFRVHPITGKHSFHTGLDIAMGEGSAISAVQSGTVITATYGDNIWGNYVEIDDGTTKTKYAHCSELNVSVGDIVKTGDVIGFVGSTGQSTGPHLHIEVIIGGQRYDPAMQLSRN